MKQNNQTITYYNNCANTYFEQTTSVPFSEQRELLTKFLSANDHILDLGCGSGRDSLAFLQAGYQVTAMDGSSQLCQLASELIKAPVKYQQFSELNEVNTYDAVWACASLLHLSTDELQDVLPKIERALKSGGYFYASFKHGTFEGDREGRFFKDFTEETFKCFMTQFPAFEVVECLVTSDVLGNREATSWLNVILRKAK